MHHMIHVEEKNEDNCGFLTGHITARDRDW